MICCWLNKINSDVVGLALGLVILKNPTSYIQFIQSKDTPYSNYDILNYSANKLNFCLLKEALCLASNCFKE